MTRPSGPGTPFRSSVPVTSSAAARSSVPVTSSLAVRRSAPARSSAPVGPSRSAGPSSASGSSSPSGSSSSSRSSSPSGSPSGIRSSSSRSPSPSRPGWSPSPCPSLCSRTVPCSKACEVASTVPGGCPPVRSQVTETVTVPPGATVRGLTSAAGSAAAAPAAVPSARVVRAVADSARAVRRNGMGLGLLRPWAGDPHIPVRPRRRGTTGMPRGPSEPAPGRGARGRTPFVPRGHPSG
ncbi:hypothetical protein FGF04_26965 [Streptomyces apricus]|uniref:Uncharacterized protein n=1 Tax=Streptomyces apricus TaxID=1828112 RepID=A0A5B0ANQ5_9ACTN|nr:hypothetical protein FGF04_26965 [Streptomyces apricus]